MEVSGRPGNALRLVLVLLLTGGLYLSVTLTRADYLGRAGRPSEAIALTPSNPWYLLQRADDGDVERALAIAPASARPRLAAALEAESAGDAAGAERHLLHATTLDATFAPRWALINYYLRQGRQEEFWKWAADGVKLYEGDLTALFRLAVAEGGAMQAWSRLQPRRAAAQRQFLDMLLVNRAMAAADYAAGGEAAKALAGHGREKDREQLLSYCERALLEGNATGAAVSVWNAMAEAGFHRLGTLDAAAGRVLTNGGFRQRPMGSGFDWRVPEARGASAHMAGGGGLSVEITAPEPGEAVLLRQILPVTPGVRYRVRTRYRKVRGDVAKGLRWRVGPQRSALFSDWAERDGVVRGEWEFDAPGEGVVALELQAAREPEHGGARGALVLEEVEVIPAVTVPARGGH